MGPSRNFHKGKYQKIGENPTDFNQTLIGDIDSLEEEADTPPNPFTGSGEDDNGYHGDDDDKVEHPLSPPLSYVSAAAYQTSRNVADENVSNGHDETSNLSRENTSNFTYETFVPHCSGIEEGIPQEDVYNTSDEEFIDGSPYQRIDEPKLSDFTKEELWMHSILKLCDDSGNRRGFYDDLIGLLKKLERDEGLDVTKLRQRKVFIQRLEKKMPPLTLVTYQVGTYHVFGFNFLDQVRDLFRELGNSIKCFDPEQFNKNSGELLGTKWMLHTFFQKVRTQSGTEIILPLLIYADRTGVDANQHYAIEPWLFTFACLTQFQREDRHSWRHLGFIPNVAKDKNTTRRVQQYHSFLYVLFSHLREAQKNPPILDVPVGPNKKTKKMKCHFPIMIACGDQLSQDTLTARRHCKKGASRIHRACMCSWSSCGDPSRECQPVDPLRIQSMSESVIKFGLTTKENKHLYTEEVQQKVRYSNGATPTVAEKTKWVAMLRRRQNFMKSYLSKVLCTHAIKNAFWGLDFGATAGGIYEATADDHMHSYELGVLKYLGELIFGGLQPTESERIEMIAQKMFLGWKCSVRENFPRWRLQEGFSRLTLMTSTERVGAILLTTMLMNNKEAFNILDSAHARQRSLYYSLNTVKLTKESDTETDSNVEVEDSEEERPESSKKRKRTGNTSTQEEVPTQLKFKDAEHFVIKKEVAKKLADKGHIRSLLSRMHEHNLEMELLEALDRLQLLRAMHAAHIHFSSPGKYPELHDVEECPDEFDLTKLRSPYEPPAHLVNSIHETLGYNQEGSPHDIQPHCLKFCGSVTSVPKGKHYHQKSTQKNGRTCVVLTSMKDLRFILELALAFHSFSHYFNYLEIEDREDQDTIECGPRMLMRYIDLTMYRGDNTHDFQTTKAHSQFRMGQNVIQTGSPMNSNCSLGERLLKTEAKGISRTAQKRGETIFTFQVASRIVERTYIEYIERLKIQDNLKQRVPQTPMNKDDKTKRKGAHFLAHRRIQGGRCHVVMAANRKGTHRQPDKSSGCIEKAIVDALFEIEKDMHDIPIWNEVKLRDGDIVRASPNYSQTGPFYDLVSVCGLGGREDSFTPAKVLCFYKNLDQTLMALVHATYSSPLVGKATLLTETYTLQYHHSGKPKIQSVEVRSIDCSIFGFSPSSLLKPGRQLHCSDNHNKGKQRLVIYRPRNEWARVWMVCSRFLSKRNRINNGKSFKQDSWILPSSPHLLKYLREEMMQQS